MFASYLSHGGVNILVKYNLMGVLIYKCYRCVFFSYILVGVILLNLNIVKPNLFPVNSGNHFEIAPYPRIYAKGGAFLILFKSSSF